MPEPEPERSEEVWSGRYLHVRVERWPGLGDYELIRKHHAVGIVPLTPAGDVLLVRQFRPPVRTELLEIPAGLLDVDGEDTLACAERELLEETGYRSASIGFLGGAYLSPGFTDEYIHLFLAQTHATPERGPEPGIELVPMAFGRAVAAARAGRFRNASTALGLLLAEAREGA